MLREIAHLRHLPSNRRMQRTMNQADFYDVLMVRADEAGVRERRASLVTDLEGDVLEIGCGTGLMFPHYKKGVRLTGIEPGEEFLRLAEERAKISEAEISLRIASGENLPFEDGSFDVVVSALVLCSVQSVEQSLSEIKRVLRASGQVRLIEHVKSDQAVAGALMHAFNPLWRALNRQGCNMNRDTERSLRLAGFTLQEVEQFQFFSRGLPAFPHRWIKAVAA